MYHHILLATDGSEHAQHATEHAVHLAKLAGATLHIASVVETRTEYDSAIIEREVVEESLRERAEEAIVAAEQAAARAGVESERWLLRGVPADELLTVIEEQDIDLVVLGEQGLSAFKTVLLGSTAEAVIHGTAVPVTVVGADGAA